MNSFPETDVGSLDPKNREQIISMARRLLRTDNVGMLCTIDERGLPQARWMATMSFDDFPDLYTLTSVEQVEAKRTDRSLGVFKSRFDVYSQFNRIGGNLPARRRRDEPHLAANRRQIACLFSP